MYFYPSQYRQVSHSTLNVLFYQPRLIEIFTKKIIFTKTIQLNNNSLQIG